MNWDDDRLCAAALRLLLTGTLRTTKAAAGLLLELEQLGLIGPTRREGQFRLQAGAGNALRRYLQPRWPALTAAEATFAARPHLISAMALRAERRRLLALPPGITHLNRKTWSAWAGAHSKSRQRSPVQGVRLTTDRTLRMRPNLGLQLVTEEGRMLSLDDYHTVLGEISIPERAIDGAWYVAGTMPALVMTVENIGAFIDLPAPPWLLLLHAPGWDTALATGFIGRLPSDVHWMHFGDLDPEGLRVGLSMQCVSSGRRPAVWVPRAAATLLTTHALPLRAAWPVQNLPTALMADPILRDLVDTRRWLEHESMVLLAAFAEELNQLALP